MRKKRITIENITVTGYAAEGKALAKVDGKVLFIKGAVPGDVVDLLLLRNKKDWAEARVLRFHSYSPERTEPFCEHFGTCGGCKWQMLPYPLQLQYKQQEVEQHFQRIGKVAIAEILPIAGAENTSAYRNKLEFTFSNKRYLTEEEIGSLPPTDTSEPQPITGALGFHAPGIFDKIIGIDNCGLMDDINNRIRNSLREYAFTNNLPFYDIRKHTGWLRNLILRYCTTGELMVNVCIGYEDMPATEAMLRHLLDRVPEITTLLYTVNTKWNDSLHDLQPKVFSGKGHVLEKLGDFTFKIGPKSFFQTNTRQAEKLYSIVRDFAALQGHETVYDLYCGTGSIGIFLSRNAKKIIGVEVVADAIDDARENAALNGIAHAEFFSGDVIKVCDDAFFARHGRPDVVITDPPRAGMHEKLVEKLLQMQAPKIVYVSCNTATQARDIALLAETYDVEKLQPVDMFPHTHHIESVALLKRKN
jgi:23S rRNA (uracil1939-C5)-methyltransferase